MSNEINEATQESKKRKPLSQETKDKISQTKLNLHLIEHHKKNNSPNARKILHRRIKTKNWRG
jgi:hypothetical protein